MRSAGLEEECFLWSGRERETERGRAEQAVGWSTTISDLPSLRRRHTLQYLAISLEEISVNLHGFVMQ